MSQIKIIKRDVINSLKNNLNENNINDLIDELKEKSSLDIEIHVLNKSYNWYLLNKNSFYANINLNKQNIKNSGYGRNEYEALKTALLNLIEDLLQNEKFINPIKESLKIFLKNIKDPKSNKENVIAAVNTKYIKNIAELEMSFNTNNESQKKIVDDVINEKSKSGFKVVNELNFNIISNQENQFNTSKFRELIKEKYLIILELEKLILDLMNYNKVK